MAAAERAEQRGPRDVSDAKRRRLEQRLKAAKPGAASALTIPKRPDSGPALLSYPQLSFWLLDQIDPGSPAYNLPHGVVFEGPLDIAALERSLGQVLGRHDVLRTRFDVIDGTPCQVVPPATDWSLPVIDFSGLAERERDAAVSRLLEEEALAPFDLGVGRPIRLKLLKRAEDDHVLVSVTHHVAFDGWSYSVFFRELSHFYEAFSGGKAPSLAEPGIQYADFAAWQRQQSDAAGQDSHLDYWLEHLSGPLGVLDLPTDRPRPATPTFHGKRYSHVFDPDLSQNLEKLASAHRATLFMVLLAAFDVLMMRHSGETDVILGTPFANRSLRETEGVIGCFVNTLVMRSDLAGDPTFDQLLDQVRQSALSAYEHQACPFQKLVEALKPERTAGRIPIVQVMFQLNNTPDGNMHLASGPDARLAVSELALSTVATNIDISVDMYETGDGLQARVEYNSDLFDEATIARLMATYETLLTGIAADQAKPISAYGLLDPETERTILQRWNATDHPTPEGGGLHDLISAQAIRSTDRPALVFDGSSLSYGALECWSNRVAHGLIAAGFAKGAMIALCMDNGFALVAGMLGIMKTGGVFVTLDPALPPARLGFMIEDSAVAVILTDQALMSTVTTAAPVAGAKPIAIDGDDNPYAGLPETAPEMATSCDDPAYVIYTSGSTGRPKGVLVPHRAILNHMQWAVDHYAITAGDPHLLIANTSFDTALWEIFAPLMTAAPLVIPRREEAQDPARLIALIREHGVSHIQTVPTLLRLLIEHPDIDQCTSLSHVFCGGEVLPAALMKAVLGRLDVSLHNAYGPTETTIDATTWQCDASDTGPSVPIGRPIRNTRCYVLDDTMRPVPMGVAGELYIGGAGVALGYLNRPALTEAAFVADPFSGTDGARLYRSGDLARWRADGLLDFLGRRDGQVKLRGLRIELGEIEHAMTAHPAVAQAIVAVRDDAPDGGRLIGYYLPSGADRPGRAAFQDAMGDMLPDYMIPQAFVAIDAIPLNKNGKIDKLALPAPTRAEPETSTSPEPSTSTEAVLAAIWCDLLTIETVGIDDNFFEMGGHSLLAVRLIATVETATGIRLPLQALFKGATIRQMANALSVAGRAGATRPFVSFNETGKRTPFWFEHGDYVGGGFYCRHLAGALGPTQPLHALTPHGADGKRFPNTIEAMAASHLQHIRNHQPAGPYRLGGHCNGGLLAFDMARQLEAMGEPVDIVVLIATPSYNLRPWINRTHAVLQNLYGEQGEGSVDFWLRRLNWLRGLVVPLGLYKQHMRQLQSLSISKEIATLRQILADYYHHKTAMDNFDRLYRDIIDRHVPGSYDRRVALLAPIEEIGPGSSLDPEVWRRVVPNLEIHAVPGGHLTCITDHGEDLAAAIDRLLD
jgi:amino acid adenylation domain-containing protein